MVIDVVGGSAHIAVGCSPDNVLTRYYEPESDADMLKTPSNHLIMMVGRVLKVL